MKQIIFTIYSFFILFALVSCQQSKDRLEVKSPDGNIRVAFEIKDGQMFYSVYDDTIPIINPSQLGFEFKNMPLFKNNFELLQVAKILVIQPGSRFGEKKG